MRMRVGGGQRSIKTTRDVQAMIFNDKKNGSTIYIC